MWASLVVKCHLKGLARCVAVAAPGGHFGRHPGLFGEAAVHALAGQDARFALGHADRLPWGGVWHHSKRASNRLAVALSKALYRDWGMCVLRLSQTRTIFSASGKWTSASSRSTWAQSTAVRRLRTLIARQPRRGAESRKRLQVPMRSYW